MFLIIKMFQAEKKTWRNPRQFNPEGSQLSIKFRFKYLAGIRYFICVP